MKYGIFIGYTFAPAWLAMPRAERARFRAEHIEPVLAKYADLLTLRHYDAEAFSADPTDFAFVTTDDLDAYYGFIEELRDSPLISTGLASMRTVHIGLADGYRRFEQQRAAQA
jgi:hypothetical protein